MNRLNNTAPVAGQDTLNLRPLPNKLGYNGPYLSGGAPGIERDCARIDGHTDLFRDLERFELDMHEAIQAVWTGITYLNVLRSREEPDDAEIITTAERTLGAAFKFMQEAYLVAEVLDDRARERMRKREAKDFLALVATTPPEEMSSLDKLSEEARLTWQISMLLDRMNHVCHTVRQPWPKIDRDNLERFIARLDELTRWPTADTLQAMTDEELAAELRGMETAIAATRKTISLIHAARTLRRG